MMPVQCGVPPVAEQRIGLQASDEGAGDSQERRADASHGVAAGQQQPGDDVDDEANDELGDQKRDHGQWRCPYRCIPDPQGYVERWCTIP